MSAKSWYELFNFHDCYSYISSITGMFSTDSDELTGVERTSLIIGGVLVFLIAVLIAITIIIVAYIYMFSPRELYAKISNNHMLKLELHSNNHICIS